MGRKLHVIGFISGGKDSFFSLIHCLANDHQIVAVANLYPPNPTGGGGEETSDLNSLMYQTVGHSLIPSYVDILSIPVYRQEIHGTAVNQAKEYSIHRGGTTSPTAMEDETESMMALLGRIVADHPEANAACSGAILSTYQRTRIESVALRMHLVPLAYLWQYPELPTPVPRKEGLLEDMAAVGLDARIVKVASGGLDEDLLWENVCAKATRKKVVKAMRRFGGSVLGEGGEFETIVVDGPAGFFTGAMAVGADERRIIRGGGGEAWLNFARGVRMREERRPVNDKGWLEKLRIPNLLDHAFEEVLRTLGNGNGSPPMSGYRSAAVQLPAMQNNEWENKYYIYVGKWTTRISNLTASHVKDGAQAQMEKMNQILLSLLKNEVCRSVQDIVFTTILLRSMDDFQAVNQKYAELFGDKPNPPARVTIASGDSLPPRVDVMVSVVVALDTIGTRQHLHVQSRSYWAPANIGPYSQATSVSLGMNNAGAIVYVAGQIPLVPASMEIVTQAKLSEEPRTMRYLADFRLQTTLALQHLWRIGKVMDTCWWIGAIAFVVAGEDDIGEKARLAALAWTAIHDRGNHIELTDSQTQTDGADFDVWDKQRVGSQSFMTEQEDAALPDFSCLSINPSDSAVVSSDKPVVPPFFTIEIAQLPRGSQIEWQALGVSQTSVKLFDRVWAMGNSITVCSIASHQRVFGFIGIKVVDKEISTFTQIEQATLLLQKRCNIPNTVNGHFIIYTSLPIGKDGLRAQVVPCKSVWNAEGEEIAVAVAVEYEIR